MRVSYRRSEFCVSCAKQWDVEEDTGEVEQIVLYVCAKTEWPQQGNWKIVVGRRKSSKQRKLGGRVWSSG